MVKFKNPRDYPDLITVPELCAMIDIGRATAYRLLKEEKIAFFKVGKKIHIPKKSVLKYLSKLAGENIE